MSFENIAPELVEKAKACHTADELVSLAKAEGVELGDEELEQLSGGGVWKENSMACKFCGKHDVHYAGVDVNGASIYYCDSCGARFTI